MKRKRFVKLLMSQGVTRNKTNATTRLIGGIWGSSYAALYETVQRNYEFFGIDYANAPDKTGMCRYYMARWDDTLDEFGYVVRDLLAPIIEAYKRRFVQAVAVLSHEEHAACHAGGVERRAAGTEERWNDANKVEVDASE